jgi:hypothetical protein
VTCQSEAPAVCRLDGDRARQALAEVRHRRGDPLCASLPLALSHLRYRGQQSGNRQQRRRAIGNSCPWYFGGNTYDTSDGSTPSAASILYYGPIPVSAFTTVRVIAIAGGISSLLTAGVYSISHVTLSLNPRAATLSPSQTEAFTASVGGSSNTSVMWSINPAAGSISAAGLYTAPASIASPETLVVTATSKADSTEMANASITLAPTISAMITPSSVNLNPSQIRNFTATVSNSSKTAVTWSINPALGSISATGVYTAPATVPSPGIITITATSTTDATKSASATVTIIPVVGPVYYLAPAGDGGNDSNSGLSPTAPWLTPNHSVSCGAVILAAASTSYSASNFYLGKWGTVTCPGGNDVAWLKCVNFDGCKISTNNHQGMWIDHSYWGVQGWEITTSGSNGNTCFFASPVYGNPVQIHHIIFANDIANGCQLGGFEIGAQGIVSVDYVAFVGDMAYNSAQGSFGCDSGMSIFQPTQSDSLPGTHIYVAGNFAWANFNSDPCNGTVPTDGQGLMIDTPDGSQNGMPSAYSARIVVDNNISVGNGGPGMKVFNNSAGSLHATIHMRHNTLWGNNADANEPSGYCGQSVVGQAVDVQQYLNIAVTAAAKACDGYASYSFFVWNGGSTDIIDNNVAWSASGTFYQATNSRAFAIGLNNLLRANPNLANPAVPQAPKCGGYSSVSTCAAGLGIISNFTPMNAAVAGYGYQAASSTNVYDPLFPQWLCNVNLPPGLVTMGCIAAGAP